MSFSKQQVSFSSNFASLFIVMKDNSSVLFEVKRHILCIKGTNQSANFLRFLSARVRFHQILVIFEATNQFFFKFYITFQCHEVQLVCSFLLKFYILSAKGAYQSTNFVKFHVSNRKSEILHFHGLLLSKSYKASAEKVQKSYLS